MLIPRFEHDDVFRIHVCRRVRLINTSQIPGVNFISEWLHVKSSNTQKQNTHYNKDVFLIIFSYIFVVKVWLYYVQKRYQDAAEGARELGLNAVLKLLQIIWKMDYFSMVKINARGWIIFPYFCKIRIIQLNVFVTFHPLSTFQLSFGTIPRLRLVRHAWNPGIRPLSLLLSMRQAMPRSSPHLLTAVTSPALTEACDHQKSGFEFLWPRLGF